MLLLVQLAGILQCLVVAQESAHAHVGGSFGVDNLDVEVAHHVVGEVIAGELEEELIFVDGVGVVGNDIEELLVAFGRELAGGNRVAVAEHHRASAPDVAQVELSTMQAASFLHTVHNHACHLGELALRELLHEQLHIGQTAVAIAVVEFRESADEDELIAVQSHREALLREACVAAHLAIAVVLEGDVGGPVERVFHMLAKLCVLLEIRVGEQRCPLTLRELLLQSCHIACRQVVFLLSRVE